MTNRGRPVRVALLGVGRMGLVHANALAALPAIEVTAFAEPNDQLAERARTVLGPNSKRYKDAIAALAEPGIDACIVVTPTPMHPKVTTAALELGLHVFCEKPLSLDVGSGKEVMALAERADRILQLGFWRRFAAPWVQARNAIATGAIGDPIIARSQQWDATLPAVSFSKPSVSGGLLIDFGVHDYDVLEWLTGQEIETVETRMLRLVEPRLADIHDLDNALVLLALSGGVQGIVELSANVRYADDARAEVLGSDGVVLIESFPKGQAFLGNASGFAPISNAGAVDTFVGGVAAELSAFAEAVRKPDMMPFLPGARESVRALAVGLAARASLQEQRPIHVRDILCEQIPASVALGALSQ